MRHFQLHRVERIARVNAIRLPESDEDAAKFVREAVRAYPELYFARFVILGEGASEEVVLPRLAEALELPIDRSFVAIVPLGGRHVNHLWRLLNDLDIPHATLLDIDIGRHGGGWGRIKIACTQFLANGLDPAKLFGNQLHPSGPSQNLKAFDSFVLNKDGLEVLNSWALWLRQYGVYFCWPLDLDYSMLQAFPSAYRLLEAGQTRPAEKGDPIGAVLGEEGDSTIYPGTAQEAFRWYRYLFLGRGKPSTHVRVLSTLDSPTLKGNIPEELQALLNRVMEALGTPKTKVERD